MGEYRNDGRLNTPGGCLRFLALITIGFIALVAFMYFGVGTSCRSHADIWLEDYPNSELVSETYTFLRPFGIGETLRVLYSPDSPNVVRNWYMERDRERDDEGLVRNDGQARVNRYIRAGDNEGTDIGLESECASQWVLWYAN